MTSSFGEQLIRFALALDSMDARNFRRVRDVVDKYTSKTLGITSTRLLISSEVHLGVEQERKQAVPEPGLSPFGLVQEGDIRVIPVGDEERGYSSQASLAFAAGKELWIVSGDPETDVLREASTYEDLWSGARDLPRYRDVTQQDIRTSILVPLRYVSGRKFGLVSFETTERIDQTPAAKRELSNLALALSIAYRCLRDSDSRARRTGEAITALDDVLNEPLLKLTKPKIFLASSERAHGDVIEALRDVIREFRDTFDEVYWKEMNRPGSIDQQLLGQLARCRYGVFYMSEPTGRKKDQYRDNINVVFEAGMLHGRSDVASPIPASWIPVREEGSPPPFDFATQRTVIVPRDPEKGELRVDDLKNVFRERLHGLIENGS